MTDWTEEYARTDSLDERYKLLREELTRLREHGRETDRFDPDTVADTVRELNEEVDGDLVVFVANDFGLPVAYRPAGTGFWVQDAVRQSILEEKYDDSQPHLDKLRQVILERHAGVHKAIVAEVDGSSLRYHLPEGSNESTNFVTVREMVGLVDYTTNSDQREGLSGTY